MEAIEIKPDDPRQPGAAGELAEIRRDCQNEVDTVAVFAAKHHLEPTSVWLAGFALLLHRLSGQTAGSFALCDGEALLSVETLQDGTPLDFLEWLGRVKAAVRRAASSRSSEDAHPIVFGPVGALSNRIQLCVHISRYQLTARFQTSLFATERVRELLEQLIVLVDQAVADSGRDVTGYSLITQSARAIVPDPTADLAFPEYRPITETILAHVASGADRAAVEQGGRSWSYRQLSEASFAVAKGLTAAGLRVGDSVAVTGPRSFGFVAAMLGVWRCGAVLVNIDPGLPEKRQELMLLEAKARFLVRVGSAANTLTGRVEKMLSISMQGGLADYSPGAAAEPLPSLSPEQAAYIFFTSGSTGTPKAVKGRHSGLSHFLQWQRQEFAIGPHDRGSQLTALSFDVVLRDSFLVLSSGGTLCIPGEWDALDPRRIIDWLQSERVSVLHVVPSLARMWLNGDAAPTPLRYLKHVFFAGEPLTDVLVKQWRRTFTPHAEIVNLYGPAETTLAKCFYRVPAVPEAGVQSLGRPLPDTQVLVLNAGRAQCGLNEPGEIAIRTPFRTLGYCNNVEANVKAFVPNPFRNSPDDLVYLTGDAGTYRTDGLLAIHGRLDNQMKIRGIRIEPGEIEAAIGRHDFVREAVVVARPDPNGGKALVAYVVPRFPLDHRQRRAFIGGLRKYLRQRLPEAMVPSVLVVLDALPLNRNGKVDRLALPPPDRSAFGSSEDSAPATKLEFELVALWRNLLHLDALGVDDDFFDLGGHSLLAVQLAQQIRRDLGRPCTLSMLFRNRTIRSLARELGLDSPNLSDATVLELQPAGEAPGLFCVCGLHLYQELADQMAPDLPVYGVFLPYEEQMLDAGFATVSRTRSIEDLAAAYVEAIRGKQPSGPYLICGVSFGGVLAYEVAHQLRQAGQEVPLVALLDSVLPIAIGRDWTRWGVDQVRRMRQEGMGAFAKRAKSQILSRFRGSVGPTRETEDAALRALQMRRRQFYQEAEFAYRVPPSSGPLLLVRAQDKSFHHSDIKDQTYGWGSAATWLEIVDVPGDHLGILSSPNVQVLAQVLRPYAARARGSAIGARRLA